MQLDKNIRTSIELYIGGIQYTLQQSRKRSLKKT